MAELIYVFGYCKRHIRNTILLYKVKYCGKVLKKPCDTQIKWYFIFSDHGCSCFLIKYISDLYNSQYLVFMMLSGLLIWFYILVHVSLLQLISLLSS